MAAMIQPAGLILAGGAGRRMGKVDKAFVTLAGQPLIVHVAERLLPQVGACAISANGDPARFAETGLPVLPDAEPGGLGPLAGILAGLDWAAGQGAETVVSAPVDTPFIPGDLVPRLLLAAEGMRAPFALACAPDGAEMRLHPACGLWPVAVRDDLRAALRQGVRRLGAWAEEAGARRCFFADGERAFFNINRPEDLARAGEILEGR